MPVPLRGLHAGVDERERLVEAGDDDEDQRLPRVRQPQPDRRPLHAVLTGDRLADEFHRRRQSPARERLRGPRNKRHHLVVRIAARPRHCRGVRRPACSAARRRRTGPARSDRNDSSWTRSAAGTPGQLQRQPALLDDVGRRVLHRQDGEAEPGLGLGRRVGEVTRGGGDQPTASAACPAYTR